MPPKVLNILYENCVTNEEISESIIQAAIGEYVELLNLVKRWKQRWFGQVSRFSGFAKANATREAQKMPFLACLNEVQEELLHYPWRQH